MGFMQAMERKFSGPGGQGWGPPGVEKLPNRRQAMCSAGVLLRQGASPAFHRATPWGQGLQKGQWNIPVERSNHTTQNLRHFVLHLAVPPRSSIET